MASPQKEDGYTPIAHEILEHLSRQVLSPDEWRILMIIFRKTYGWDKKYDKISHSQFAELTGIARGHIPRILNRLLERKMIFKAVPQPGVPYSGDCPPIRGRGGVPYLGDRHMATYGFQKNYDLWCPLTRGQQVSP